MVLWAVAGVGELAESEFDCSLQKELKFEKQLELFRKRERPHMHKQPPTIIKIEHHTLLQGES